MIAAADTALIYGRLRQRSMRVRGAVHIAMAKLRRGGLIFAHHRQLRRQRPVLWNGGLRSFNRIAPVVFLALSWLYIPRAISKVALICSFRCKFKVIRCQFHVAPFSAST